MKTLLSGICACLIIFSTFAQKSPVSFGEIPMSDMAMTIYDEDSSASAVVLVDYGEAYINVYGEAATLTFERHTRIKVLKKDGLKWANASVPLYFSGSSEEKVVGLKAVTYNLENGKITETKMSKESVFKEKFSRNFNLHKFTLPNVKEGSVIEYSYKVISEFYTNFPNWQFQKTIPTRHSEYWAIIPTFFIYQKYMQGYLAVNSYDVKPSANSNAHHWIVKNAPAFREEPYMTSEDDYISKMNFALSHINFPGQPVQEIMGSWQKLNDLLIEDESFGRVIDKSGFLKKQVEEITSGMTDPLQKITAIHTFVKQNIEWDGYKDFYPASLKKVLEEKKGTSGDINVLLASMIDKLGIPVDMVLVSTRDHGFIRKDFPMSKQFNYIVCAVRLGDKTLLLDGTEKYLPVNVLPERCLNGEGLVISKTRHGWISLESKTRSRKVVMADLTLEEGGELKGKLNFSREGYFASNMRKDFISKGQENYVKEFLGTRPWELQKSDFQNINVVDQSVKENHELTIREHAMVAGDVIYINPFVTSQLESNPFKLEKREYPVDFGSQTEELYMCKFTIPEGYVIDEAPQSRVLMMPGNAARYLYNVTLAGNTINITSNFQINRNIFIQTDYPHLREFYNQVVAKQAEQIVIKKK